MASHLVAKLLSSGSRRGRWFDLGTLLVGSAVMLRSSASNGSSSADDATRFTGIVLLFAVAAQVVAAQLKRRPLQERLAADGRKIRRSPLALVMIMHWVLMFMALGQGIAIVFPEAASIWRWAKLGGGANFAALLALIAASTIPSLLVWRAFHPIRDLTPASDGDRRGAQELAADVLTLASVQALFATMLSEAELHTAPPMGLPDRPIEWLMLVGFLLPVVTIAYLLIYLPPRVLLLAEDLAHERGGWSALLAVQPWVWSYVV